MCIRDRFAGWEKDERLVAAFAPETFEGALLFVSANGMVKRALLNEYDARKSKLAAAGLKDGDEIVCVQLLAAPELLLVSRQGMAIHFAVEDLSLIHILYADCEWQNYKFTLIDTGGIDPDSEDPLLQQMRRQAEIAIETCDVILFFVDGRQGMTADDENVADLIRRAGKPLSLIHI